MVLMQISRSRFKQSRISGLFCKFFGDVLVYLVVFLKGLVKFMEIGNFEDLVLF